MVQDSKTIKITETVNLPAPAQVFASHLIAELASYGAGFWLAPGARSQSLAIAAAQLPADSLHVRIDERSLGFHALGAAIKGDVQVVITTSGTAVANLHPAVLEAHHSGVPLILLTADRPAHLRGRGANQTTNQVGIFGDAVIECIDVAYPDDDALLPEKTKELAAQAVELAVLNSQPVQLNLQFIEPLSDVLPDAGDIFAGLPSKKISVDSQEEIELELSSETVVIAGANAGEYLSEITELGLPILAEPSSGVRHLANSVIGYRFLLSGNHSLFSEIKQVIVYGKPTLSRPVIALLNRADVEVLVRPGRMGAFLIPENATVVNKRISCSSDKSWLNRWLEADPEHNGSSVLDRAAIVEQAWLIDTDNLVLGASQLIREADFYAPRVERNVWANRGLSGIDGTIATSTGLASKGGRTRVLLGDLTFLHDVGSLVIDKADGDIDLQLVVVNDHGGKIFEGLEVKKTASSSIYDRVFKTGQSFDIEKLAQGFGWEYVRVSSLSEYVAALGRTGRVIIEIRLD